MTRSAIRFLHLAPFALMLAVPGPVIAAAGASSLPSARAGALAAAKDGLAPAPGGRRKCIGRCVAQT